MNVFLRCFSLLISQINVKRHELKLFLFNFCLFLLAQEYLIFLIQYLSPFILRMSLNLYHKMSATQNSFHANIMSWRMHFLYLPTLHPVFITTFLPLINHILIQHFLSTIIIIFNLSFQYYFTKLFLFLILQNQVLR